MKTKDINWYEEKVQDIKKEKERFVILKTVH